ncbi:hypothetical protein HPB50_015359 [Hyalomma asiaticum]|uniref:Uncharacterized protein n=1 Tax=Hyalomma asiaticum TaxID=266040 RepID=A0ACB7TJ18_HYAAI|nr:hypothetical protein HPB50_015359 [Hyalomma asiaticum]
MQGQLRFTLIDSARSLNLMKDQEPISQRPTKTLTATVLGFSPATFRPIATVQITASVCELGVRGGATHQHLDCSRKLTRPVPEALDRPVYSETRARKIALSGDTVRQKALDFACMLGVDDFRPCCGTLNKRPSCEALVDKQPWLVMAIAIHLGSPKYMTYSFMDASTNKIVHFLQVHLGEQSRKSSPSPRKKSPFAALKEWIQSVVNHLYWCVAVSEGDADLAVAMWKRMDKDIFYGMRETDKGVALVPLHPNDSELDSSDDDK